MGIFNEHIQTGIDANAATASDSLDIRDNGFASFTVTGSSGTHATHVITLQCSLDDSNWNNTAVTLTGLGLVDNVQVTVRYVRLLVTTLEGGASVVDIIIQAK